MPDWTYRTFAKPILEALPRVFARQGVLHSLAFLARIPGGLRILDFFGHMQPDPRLRVEMAGRSWSTPVGIGVELDPEGLAECAWSRFGVGFVERNGTLDRDGALPGWVRVSEARAGSLRPHAAGIPKNVVGFVVEIAEVPSALPRVESMRRVVELARAGAPVRLVVVAVDVRMPWETIERLIDEALAAGADGVRFDTGWTFATDSPEFRKDRILPRVLEVVRKVRGRFGSGPLVIAGGGEVPADVLAFRRVGVDLVVLDSGLVRSGPGLPKRINAALLFDALGSTSRVDGRVPEPWARGSWFWCALLGVAMLLGGGLALVIASTRVVLPYDEVWCGMPRAGFEAINPRLLPFMSHDRVSLAGTMISLGGLYVGLALGAVRRGAHWARTAVVASATAGFFSFFLFLGFGYFDPFHAFVTAILFQFLIMALYAPTGTAEPIPYPDLDECRNWRWGQWGQLLFVMLGVGLVGAGIVIASIGSHGVFVREDLEYLRTSIESLRAANPRLIPVVAHDRASLGGMLIASGLGVWLTAQWGFTGGARWLWWTLALSGTPAFVAAITIHMAVGYTDPWHLAPAFLGAAVFVVALALSRGWLCRTEASRRSAWRPFVSAGAEKLDGSC
ncbi:MAG: hypothetical protein AB7J34_12305 [Limisphaerales bacterium]